MQRRFRGITVCGRRARVIALATVWLWCGSPMSMVGVTRNLAEAAEPRSERSAVESRLADDAGSPAAGSPAAGNLPSSFVAAGPEQRGERTQARPPSRGTAENAAVAESGGQAFQFERDLVYHRVGDTELRADLYSPKGDGPHPAVLMVHGGAWMSGHKGQMGAPAKYLAGRGYVVASINYRLAPRHRFPAQVEDCKAAVRWLRRKAGEFRLDPQRIAGYGYSAGGHLVCMLGVTQPTDGFDARDGGAKPDVSTRLQAVVAGGAPCDLTWLPEDADWLSFFLGGTRRELPDTYRRASPITFVSAADSPTLLFHGEVDRLVPPRVARGFHDRMIAKGATSEFFVVKGKGHIAAFLDPKPVRIAADFLAKHLRTGDAKLGEKKASAPEMP